MNAEEINAFFNNQEKELAETKRKHQVFINDLEEELLILPFSYLPQIGKSRARFIEPLKQELHTLLLSINDNLEYHLYPLSNYTDENLCNFKVKQRSDYPSEKEEIEKAIRSLTVQDNESVEEMRQCVLAEREEREFVFLCHDKMKEIIYTHFPGITEISGNALRDLNCITYSRAREYRTAFYYLTMDYRQRG